MRILLASLVATAAWTTAQSPLTTTFVSNNAGAAGGAVYFEVECTDPAGLTITDFDLNVAGAGAVPASCEYYLQELAPGATCDPMGSWAGPIGTGAAASTAPTDTPTSFALSQGLPLGPGCRFCVAVVATDFVHAYTTAIAPFPLVYSTAELTLTACCASNVPFATPVFAPRVANVNLHYQSGGACASLARCVELGDGCVDAAGSFYEVLSPATMDLAGTTMTVTVDGSGEYLVGTAPGVVAPIGSVGAAASLALGDDEVLPAGTLGLEVSSNCQVFDGPGGSPDFVPDVATFLGGPPTYWSSWTDLQPDAVGSGQVFYEENGGVAQITYDGVYGWGTTTPNTVQFVIDTATGDFSITWGALSASNPENWLVGYSPAGASQDPGPDDLSAGPVGPRPLLDRDALRLTCSNRPVTGGAWRVMTSNVDASSQIHLRVVGLTSPGLPLDVLLGFPAGCTLWSSGDVIDVDVFVAQPAAGSFTWVVLPAIPPGFEGFEVSAQAVTLAAGLELIGITSRASNGLTGTIGGL